MPMAVATALEKLTTGHGDQRFTATSMNRKHGDGSH